MSFWQNLKNLEYLFKIDLREWLVLFNYETSSVRSLHWTILLLFYALLLQWSIIATTIFSHSPSRIPPISSTQAIIFYALRNVPSYLTLTFANCVLLFFELFCFDWLGPRMNSKWIFAESIFFLMLLPSSGRSFIYCGSIIIFHMY